MANGYHAVNRFIKNLPVNNPDLLRKEIKSSIKNPFPQADTLILETRWMICGNSSPEEIPTTFDINLEEKTNINILSKQLQLTVITMADFNKVMDTVLKYRFNNEYPRSLWDTCRIGKVNSEIKAVQLSSTKVRLYENYLYNDSAKFIRKDFTFDGKNWQYKITESSTQYLGKTEAKFTLDS